MGHVIADVVSRVIPQRGDSKPYSSVHVIKTGTSSRLISVKMTWPHRPNVLARGAVLCRYPSSRMVSGRRFFFFILNQWDAQNVTLILRV